MWDLTTALLATAVVAGGAVALPPPSAWGRRVLRGGWHARCAAGSYVGAHGSGAGACWRGLSVIGRSRCATGVHYRSAMALWVIDRTPLRWTIPRYWQLRRRAAPR